MRKLKIKFLNKSIPVYLSYKEMIKPMKRKNMKVEALFLDKILALGIIKV